MHGQPFDEYMSRQGASNVQTHRADRPRHPRYLWGIDNWRPAMTQAATVQNVGKPLGLFEIRLGPGTHG